MKALVVDDDVFIRDLIRAVASMKGLETLAAENGLQALEIAGRFACDLIITDQEMPGMKGLELIAQLTLEGYPAQYLLVSGFGVRDPQAAGFPVLVKPFTVDQLLNILEELTSKRTPIELAESLRAAKQEWEAAIAEMDLIIGRVPSKIPHPDGNLIIQKAGQKRRVAYRKYLAAYRKYLDALK